MTPALIRQHYATLGAYPAHWPTISFSNHDVPRTASRFGGQDASPEEAKQYFALLLALKGTTLIYQGEELGLPQAHLRRDQLRDPVGDLYWPYSGGRDGCRTPMPWNDGANLGFSTGAPWLPAAPEHAGLTIEAQTADAESPLAFAREMIAFRKASPALTTGELTFLNEDESGAGVRALRRQRGGRLPLQPESRAADLRRSGARRRRTALAAQRRGAADGRVHRAWATRGGFPPPFAGISGC